MRRAFQMLLSLYPRHVRAIYGPEMLTDIERRYEEARQNWLGVVGLLAREALTIMPDAISERASCAPRLPHRGLTTELVVYDRQPLDLRCVFVQVDFAVERLPGKR